MALTLYSDKSQMFNFELEIQGADSSKARARLVLYFPSGKNCFFKGLANNIEIPALNFVKEKSGKCVLEVIVGHTLFELWSDNFNIISSKYFYK